MDLIIISHPTDEHTVPLWIAQRPETAVQLFYTITEEIAAGRASEPEVYVFDGHGLIRADFRVESPWETSAWASAVDNVWVGRVTHPHTGDLLVRWTIRCEPPF